MLVVFTWIIALFKRQKPESRRQPMPLEGPSAKAALTPSAGSTELTTDAQQFVKGVLTGVRSDLERPGVSVYNLRSDPSAGADKRAMNVLMRTLPG